MSEQRKNLGGRPVKITPAVIEAVAQLLASPKRRREICPIIRNRFRLSVRSCSRAIALARPQADAIRARLVEEAASIGRNRGGRPRKLLGSLIRLGGDLLIAGYSPRQAERYLAQHRGVSRRTAYRAVVEGALLNLEAINHYSGERSFAILLAREQQYAIIRSDESRTMDRIRAMQRVVEMIGLRHWVRRNRLPNGDLPREVLEPTPPRPRKLKLSRPLLPELKPYVRIIRADLDSASTKRSISLTLHAQPLKSGVNHGL